MKTETVQEKKSGGYPTTIWNRAFTGVFVANACMGLAQQMMNALVARYTDYLGATPTVVGVVTSLFAITALLFKIISGPAIDSFNRRAILMGAMLVMAASYFGYSISSTVPMMIGFRLLQGSGMAFTATCCLAIAADNLPPDQFGSGMGIFSMAQAASQAIGPTIALWLVDLLGYNFTFAIGGCMMLLSMVAVLQVKTGSYERKKFRITLNGVIAKESILPAILMLFLSMAFFVTSSFLIIYAGRQGVDNIGIYFTVYAGTLLVTRFLVGKITDRYGLVKVLIPAMFCFAASFILISFSYTLWMFLLAAFISAFGYGACQPAIQTLSMKCVPPDRRGAAGSTNYIGIDLGVLSGPVIAGAAAEAYGYAFMWRFMLFPVVIALVIVLLSRGRITRVEEDFKAGSSN